MRNTTTTAASAAMRVARPLIGETTDYDPLLELIGEARLVLLGEASHGTHEFYHARAAITRRLIEERGFTAVAVEADWPDAYRVNRWACGGDDDPDAEAALGGFRRFPIWMWRNTVVRDFVTWLRRHNGSVPPGLPKVGFYGLDLYSLNGSIAAVLEYLERVDPEAAARARARYGCFEHYEGDSQAYGYATSFGVAEPCEDDVVAQLVELQRRAGELAGRDGQVAEDEYFHAEQNARLVRNAERYYRSMFGGRASSWNLRDTHMADTLDALVAHLDRAGADTKVVVWAHNSHLGDARATEMGERGELNVGQLVRERWGRAAVLVGFSTHAGTVTAADDWDQPGRVKRVRPGLADSYEALFHEAGQGAWDGGADFFLPLRDVGEASAGLREPRLERAIGVIYRPETERRSHYFHARLPDQFDAVLHFDETRAVEPLDQDTGWDSGEVPETFPVGV
jgi:erythromycin esterase-like protein